MEKEFPHLAFTLTSYVIPHLSTIRESGIKLDEEVKNYAYVFRMRAASENKRVDHAVKCVSIARPDSTN
jgi:hypothetical protein